MRAWIVLDAECFGDARPLGDEGEGKGQAYAQFATPRGESLHLKDRALADEERAAWMRVRAFAPRHERRHRCARCPRFAPLRQIHKADAVRLVAWGSTIPAVREEKAEVSRITHAGLGGVASKNIDLKAFPRFVPKKDRDGAEVKLGGFDSGGAEFGAYEPAEERVDIFGGGSACAEGAEGRGAGSGSLKEASSSDIAHLLQTTT